jgi:transposase-like protein
MPAPTLARPDLQHPEIDVISPCPRCLGPGKPRTPNAASASASVSQHVTYKCESCGQTWSESRTSAFDRT